jgi:hypothetical protein
MQLPYCPLVHSTVPARCILSRPSAWAADLASAARADASPVFRHPVNVRWRPDPRRASAMPALASPIPSLPTARHPIAPSRHHLDLRPHRWGIRRATIPAHRRHVREDSGRSQQIGRHRGSPRDKSTLWLSANTSLDHLSCVSLPSHAAI